MKKPESKSKRTWKAPVLHRMDETDVQALCQDGGAETAGNQCKCGGADFQWQGGTPSSICGIGSYGDCAAGGS